MTARRASTSAVAAVLGAALLMIVLPEPAGIWVGGLAAALAVTVVAAVAFGVSQGP